MTMFTRLAGEISVKAKYISITFVYFHFALFFQKIMEFPCLIFKGVHCVHKQRAFYQLVSLFERLQDVLALVGMIVGLSRAMERTKRINSVW